MVSGSRVFKRVVVEIDISPAFLTFHGTSLHNNVVIPFAKYRPESSTVSFFVEGEDIGVSMTLPKWNTRSLYVKPERSNDICRVGQLRLDASYCYFDEVHPENIDQLKLMFTVSYTQTRNRCSHEILTDCNHRLRTWFTKLAVGQFVTS